MKTICASCGAEVEPAAEECPRCSSAVLLAERCRLMGVLGRGANGITYRSERITNGKVFAVIGLFVLVPLVFIAWRALHSKFGTKVAPSTAGSPELYARPVVADVNGDGVEDMLLVTAVERSPESTDDPDDTWAREHGRFDAFVQAVDGADGRLLYSLPQGRAYTSAGHDAKSSPRIVLIATRDRLGVARVPVAGKASITIHELASGKELKELSFEQSTGRACENRGGASSPKGSFFFERSGGPSGTVIDLERATATPGPSTCSEAATPNVADVPAEAITDRTVWPARFSQETRLRKGAGPYGGRTIVVLSSGLGFVVVDANKTAPKPTAPTTSFDDGGGLPDGRDDTKVEIVGLDVAAGTTRFERSLASLGFTTEVVDHIEATDQGPILFFEGSAGLALVGSERGDERWSVRLPKGHRLSSYTLSRTRAYLHVFGPERAHHGGLSKKLGSRILVVDLATGRYLRSLPEGPLDPEPPAPKRTLDPASL